MGVNPNLSVPVYVNGVGTYIHKEFAKRHRIPEGASIHPSVMERHNKEVPMEERTKMFNWIHPDDRPYLRVSEKYIGDSTNS